MSKSIIRRSVLFISFIMMLMASLVTLSNGVRADEICTKVDGLPNLPIYRVYFPPNGEHLYTIDPNEKNALVSSHGWNDEGIDWYSPRVGEPVYRLYHSESTLREHLYTTDTNEVRVLTTPGNGWVSDNNGQPLFFSGGSVPVYRLFDPQTGNHLLTKDAHEYDVLSHNGWNGEGVALHGGTETGTVDYPIGPFSIENVPGNYAIEADVKFDGSGQGYHAKIGLMAPLSAISFGLQFDEKGNQGYAGVPAFLVENVMSNDAGQQQYVHGNLGAINKTFRIMLALESNGDCHYYINGTEVGKVNNPNLANHDVDPRVEGSARVNGDRIDATFSNIKIKKDGVYDASKQWNPSIQNTNSTMHSDISQFASNKTVRIYGTVSGLAPGQDWDSAYNQVSGNVNFYKY